MYLYYPHRYALWTETIRGYKQVHIHVDRNHPWVQTGAYSYEQKPYVGRQVHIHVDRNHTWVQTGAYSCGQKPYMGTDRCIFMWIETIRGYRQVHIHVDRNHT
jgi:ribosomal protein S16